MTSRPFAQAVARIIRSIPRGTTLSYSGVAALAGRPGAPRAVVSALRALPDVPWWRVARADGTFAPQVARAQALALRKEGWRPPTGRRGARGTRRGVARSARPALQPPR